MEYVKPIQWRCSKCGTFTFQETLLNIDNSGPEKVAYSEKGTDVLKTVFLWLETEWNVSKCTGCGSLNFCHYSGKAADFESKYISDIQER